ncbi:hypothetical protein L1889_06660 [Paenalcaligenes niemegkensis]|uniref:hypothetical protein n=1 Tax=Paenalcaligenes niemegkensis TaxID=2895469 RepID=UPI001EE7D267|nr:hypothetical protein [Paenalcaligenes niemegkensis]MCQ9616427.1 hypothetical protein [Paenalcaligenes niemegkensis]
MLAQNLEQWLQGFEDSGIAIGEARKVLKDERQVLLKQMHLKFGAIPDWAYAKLDVANAEQLDI